MAIVLKSGPSAIARLGHPATSGEIVELPRVCAIFDKPFIARYGRGAGGLFRLLETAKFEHGTGKGTASKKRVSLLWSKLDRNSAKERCPWCGANGPLTECGGCEMWVCSGQLHTREGKDYFRCRKSCGTNGFVEGFVDLVEGWQGAPPIRRAGLAKGKSQAALPEPPPRLRLKS